MKNAQKPDHLSLNTLVGWLREGRFAVPDFQREFEWRPWDIRDLMRSMFLDYYIGSLLLWRGKPENFKALSCESLFGRKDGNKPEYIVLDGQQRLTAINYAFFAPNVPLPGRSSVFFYYVDVRKFMSGLDDEAFGYDRVTREWRQILQDKNRQFEQHVFPLSVLGAGGWDLANWVQGYQAFWEQKGATRQASGDKAGAKEACSFADNAKAFGLHLKELTEQYQISYIELDKEIGVEKVRDIFTQINSRGVRLDVFDLINAMLKPKEIQLKLMWREVASKFDFVDSDKMNVYVLQVMSLLVQAYCSPKYLYYLLPGQEKPIRSDQGGLSKSVLVESPARFKALWNAGVEHLAQAIAVLKHPNEYGVASGPFLPYVSILPCFAAIRASIKSLPPENRLGGERKLRKWYWSSVFTNRYSGSVESTSARDFSDLQEWFRSDEAEPEVIREFSERFRSIDLKNEIKRGTSIYNGVFNLLVIKGARDWISGEIPPYDDIDDHHIVPISWARENLKGLPYQSVLNRTALTSDTNRNVISDRLPNEYLPELMAQSGEKHVYAVLESHLISRAAVEILLRSQFGRSDFEDFINERQNTIANSIEDLLIKERIDLPPGLHELDVRVEKLELWLRKAVYQTFGSDSTTIPSHISVKVQERIQKALKKSPFLKPHEFDALEKQLEYFDLRELQGCDM